MSDHEFLKGMDNVDPDMIDDLFEQLHKLGIDKPEVLSIAPGKFGTVIEINGNENKRYYAGISVYGYLEIVREGSPSGKIIYVPLDD